jgi:hypothetical protein
MISNLISPGNILADEDFKVLINHPTKFFFFQDDSDGACRVFFCGIVLLKKIL